MSDTTATIEKDSITILGGWSEFRPLTPQDELVFKEATKVLLGVDYKPMKVSTQAVNGINYKFICESKAVAPEAVSHIATVFIYKPVKGIPVVTKINMEYAAEATCGGWQPWEPVNPVTLKIFNKAMGGLLGVNYEPYEVSIQTVAGTNYKFKCNAQVVAPGTKPFTAIVRIFVGLPVNGKFPDPVLIGIDSFE